MDRPAALSTCTDALYRSSVRFWPAANAVSPSWSNSHSARSPNVVHPWFEAVLALLMN
jgi:hypothetical protein